MDSNLITIPALELDLTIEQMKCLTKEIKAFLRSYDTTSPPKPPMTCFGGGQFSAVSHNQLSPVQSSKWRRVGQTDRAAHEGQAVHTIMYVDDGNPVGTLYSTSSGYLNSWRCGGKGSKPKKGKVDSQLTLDGMQKNTGYHIYSLCYMPLGKLLVGAGLEIASQSPALLSISADPVNNYLGPKDVRAPPTIAMKVDSLHSIPALAGCVAASGNGSVTIFDVGRGDFSIQKTSWVAHQDFVTCLRAAPPQPHLLSGSQCGDIHYWDLRAASLSPAAVLRYHTRTVTDLQPSTAQQVLYSASADGSLLQWDLRRTQTPVAMFIPDLVSVLSLQLHPQNPSLLALSTLKGLYCLDLQDNSLTSVSSMEEKVAYPAVEWNTQNGLLYACKLDGELEAWQMSPV
eukprot:GGOE01044608.1.p1 GENE.GGOE01044608.1~~GGOE01044608.1.p1  ORF type:complete len:436 (+),score=121.98 GGOE01044608.1:112-1308(+)